MPKFLQYANLSNKRYTYSLLCVRFLLHFFNCYNFVIPANILCHVYMPEIALPQQMMANIRK